MRFERGVVRYRIPILIIAVLLMIPAVFGYAKTRVNYDMLNYLPEDMDTVKGQNILLKDFGKGAISFVILEDMEPEDVSALKQKIEKVDHVDSVLWIDSVMDPSIPLELLPEEVYKAFNTDHSTMMAVFFDSSTSAEVTMKAVRDIRALCGKQCFVSGMSALVTDLKDLCEKEEPIYVGIAVACALAAMMIFLDGFLVPFVFLANIGMMIVLNLGSNVFFGEISYITKALAAVLQLAVTMDYSIFLWNSYNEQREKTDDPKEAMALAVKETLTSVLGSSVTTVAGFIALCFMSFTMGRDLGLVMAKGVILGVIGCVTVLPAMILLLDKPLQATKHKPILPRMNGLSKGLLKLSPVLTLVFLLLIAPAYYGYSKTNAEVYYDLGNCIPDTVEYVKANEKLKNDFSIGSTHMVLIDSRVSRDKVREMAGKMEQVEGVKTFLSLDSLVGERVPEELLPEAVTRILKSDEWQLALVSSEYQVASDAANTQIDTLQGILKEYDPKGMLIGEGPCMKDMIETTDYDFRVVNIISIALVFMIILLVEKSLSLPVILIGVIELATFINLGLAHYTGTSLPFIAPICISTIQLGATVDYAILMTTRYKEERLKGAGKRAAVLTALTSSTSSIIVSGMGLFAATIGVAIYSDIDIVGSMCLLLARGALISMACVILFLPALLLLFDKVICLTTLKMGQLVSRTGKSGRMKADVAAETR